MAAMTGLRLAAGPRRAGVFQRWIIPAAVVALLAGGWFAAGWRSHSLDAANREQLLDQATAIARAVNPELLVRYFRHMAVKKRASGLPYSFSISSPP
jgi:hypothetical protein